MDIALVTGADSALGLALVERLLRQGFRVHGIGNNFSAVSLSHPEFQAHALDLTDLPAVHSAVGAILEKEGACHLLVHAIDVSPGTTFDKQTIGGLEGVLRIGLTGPVMMTRLVLPNLIRFRGGLVFVLSSGKPGFHVNATCGLIEGGLRRFATELLLQHRDAGLRVSTVLLQQNEELPAPGADRLVAKQARVDLLDVADLIERIVAEGSPNQVGELSVFPRTGPAAEPLPEAALAIDPYREVRLPPKEKRPEEKTPIATAKPVRPQRVLGISDEELEERIAEVMEEYSSHPERFDPSFDRSSRPERGRGRDQEYREPTRRDEDGDEETDDESGEEAGEPGEARAEDRGENTERRPEDSRKKRNRNRNRNRKRNRDRDRERPREDGGPAGPVSASGAQEASGETLPAAPAASPKEQERPERLPDGDTQAKPGRDEATEGPETVSERSKSGEFPTQGGGERRSRSRRRGGRGSGDRRRPQAEGGEGSARTQPSADPAPAAEPSSRVREPLSRESPPPQPAEAAPAIVAAEPRESVGTESKPVAKKTPRKRVVRKTAKKADASETGPGSAPSGDAGQGELPLG